MPMLQGNAFSKVKRSRDFEAQIEPSRVIFALSCWTGVWESAMVCVSKYSLMKMTEAHPSSKEQMPHRYGSNEMVYEEESVKEQPL